MSAVLAPVPAPAALELHEVRKTLGRTEVLRGCSLRVEAGERLAIIGPNGAGKSTLFDLASGRAACSSGEIRLHGRRIDGLAPHQVHRLGLSRSFQASQLFARLSVFENLRCAAMRSMGEGYAFWRLLSRQRAFNERAEQLAATLGLDGERDQPAGSLGQAQQRALDIGITVAGGAGVVLLDEPTAGMSRSETARFVHLIRELTQGRTLLMVEHDMDVVFGLADRIAVLVQGEFIAIDRPAAVRDDPRVQQAYLGALLAEAPVRP